MFCPDGRELWFSWNCAGYRSCKAELAEHVFDYTTRASPISRAPLCSDESPIYFMRCICLVARVDILCGLFWWRLADFPADFVLDCEEYLRLAELLRGPLRS